MTCGRRFLPLFTLGHSTSTSPRLLACFPTKKAKNRSIPTIPQARKMEAPGPKHGDPAVAGDGGDLFLRLLELRDRRLQAAAFFLSIGCTMVIYGTIANPSVNPEHLFAGFAFFTIGAALAFLTLGTAGPGRAAARMEEALRGFF